MSKCQLFHVVIGSRYLRIYLPKLALSEHKFIAGYMLVDCYKTVTYICFVCNLWYNYRHKELLYV